MNIDQNTEDQINKLDEISLNGSSDSISVISSNKTSNNTRKNTKSRSEILARALARA